MSKSRWQIHQIRLLIFRFRHTFRVNIMVSGRQPLSTNSEWFSEAISCNHLTVKLKPWLDLILFVIAIYEVIRMRNARARRSGYWLNQVDFQLYLAGHAWVPFD